MTKLKLNKGLISIGCDPELMIEDKTTGILMSAPDLLTGTKEAPQKVKGGAVHADNVNIEFNTKPAKSAKGFVDSIAMVLSETTMLVGNGNKLVVRASADFPSQALSHPDTQKFGCEPDFDAWKLRVNQIDDDATAKSFRSAGGHVHIGKTKISEKLLMDDYGRVRVVKMMDLFAGIISVILDSDPSSIKRRSLYGKAGAHRPKPYGVEYRSLGNFWIKSPELVRLIHDLTCYAVQACVADQDAEIIEAVGEEFIQDTINNSNRSDAKEIFKSFISNMLPDNILEEIKKLEGKEFDFYTEWKLTG